MDVHSSKFDLLHLIFVIVAVPIAIFAIGSDKVAKAGQQPNSQQVKEANNQNSLKEQNGSVGQQTELRRSIIADLPNLLFNEQCPDVNGEPIEDPLANSQPLLD